MNILDYAASVPTPADWTAAFQQAIADLRTRGGGTLIVPAGDYPTGAIRLYDNMTLHIESGAVLRFHQDASAFPLIDLEFEGIAGLAHQPCIYAEHAKNVTITGYGTLDGQGSYWWTRQRAGQNAHPRPYLVCFNHCEHVTLENVTLTNSPAWTVHPLYCRNRQVCERIIISNCHFLHGHGGVVLGSEMSGGIRNVVVSSCVFYETDRGIRLKTRRGRGGTVEGIQLNNLVMEKVMCPFVFNMYYFCGANGKMKHVWDKAPYPVTDATPCLRDVVISDVRARQCTACAGFFYGLAEMPVEGVKMQNVVVEMVDGAPGRPAMMDGCPEMQRAGFYLRNAADVDLRGVAVRGVQGDWLDADDSVQLTASADANSSAT